MAFKKENPYNDDRLSLSGTDSVDAHIWRISLETGDANINRLLWVLSDEELQRANRFHFEQDRKRFVVARGLLRMLLSDYCNSHPVEHYFNYNSYGKPALSGNPHIRFNVSHAGDMVLIGICCGREIGVDVERIRPFERAEQIVERYFSTLERSAFRSLPEHLRDKAFFTCWTRKEAYIKAVGKGMSLPLNKFSISFLPDTPPRLLEAPPDDGGNRDWSMQEITVNPGYAAAAVVEGMNVVFIDKEWAW